MGLFGKLFGAALIIGGVALVAASGGLGAPVAAGIAGAAPGFAAFAATTLGRLAAFAAQVIGRRALESLRKFKAGIQTSTLAIGEDEPERFIVGKYATAGAQTFPAKTWQKNRFLVQRIELSHLPGCVLSRMSVDGEWITDDGLDAGLWGAQATGKYTDRIWVKYYDGSQTAADPRMLADFGGDAEQPYNATMVGNGICYAVVTAKFDQNLFQGQPAFRFELDGISLYDPRKDTSVGGLGTHRWATPTTWETTRNPMVIVYNIMRGITLRSGKVWGGQVLEEDLPLDNWFAAMNDCDEPVQIGGGIGPRYECGFEIAVNEQPADIVEEILKSCSGILSDVGGTWYARAGSPDLAVVSLTDDDMLNFEPVSFTPHGGIEKTANAITVTFPDPSQNYEPRQAPTRTNATWEIEDGGKRLTRDINLSAVPFPGRAQIIAKEMHEDERRQVRHVLATARTVPLYPPLTTIDFTSEHFGHVGKDFEVAVIVVDLLSLNSQRVVREVNPADFTPPAIIDTTLASPVNIGPETVVPTGFALSAVDVLDATGTARRPGIKAAWTNPPTDALGVQFQVRVTATAVVTSSPSVGDAQSLDALIRDGVLPGTQHDVRMKFVLNDRPSDWSSWLTITANNAQLTSSDLGQSSVTASKILTEDQTNLVPDSDLQDAASWGNPTKFTVIPTSTNTTTSKTKGEVQYTGALPVTVPVASNSTKFPVLPGEKLLASYQVGRINGTTHTVRGAIVYFDRAGAVVGASLVGGSLTATATALVDRSAVITVPAGAWSALFQFLVDSTDGNVRFHAPVVRRMNAADLVVDGGLTNAQIADLAAAKITGQITGTQITDSAITTPKLAAGSVTTAKLVANAVTANEIVTGAIITSKINGRAVTSLETAASGASFTVTSSTGFNLQQNFVVPNDDTNIRISVQYPMGAVVTPFSLVQNVTVDGVLLSQFGLQNVQEIVLAQSFKLIPVAKTISVSVDLALTGSGSVEVNGLSFTVEQFKR